MAHNYILHVTAGPDYDASVQKIIAVNTAEPHHISTEHIDVDLNVRIRDYRGLPRSSPTSSPYFELPAHAKSGDRYSIGFRFTPKHDINGDDLVFGNDFDHPIRDRLPPGFGTAFKIVKWAIDPGLDGDVYAEKPYLYGPLASSINTFRVGETQTERGDDDELEMGENGEGIVFEEGAWCPRV
jgi:hypothetical protein